MTAGRKPTPTHLKLVKGNPGRRALPKSEAQVVLARPTVPAHLTDDAKVEWGRVSDELHKVGLLSGIDRAALAAYCQAYGRWVAAERGIEALALADPTSYGGLLVQTKNGNGIQNPLVGTANKAMADMVRYAVEFGMTPSARSRIVANPPGDQETDKVAAYFNR